MYYPVSSRCNLLMVTLLVLSLWGFSSAILATSMSLLPLLLNWGLPSTPTQFRGESNEEALIRNLHFIPLYHNGLMKCWSCQHCSFYATKTTALWHVTGRLLYCLEVVSCSNKDNLSLFLNESQYGCATHHPLSTLVATHVDSQTAVLACFQQINQ